MSRPALSILLAFICSVHAPAFAQAYFVPSPDVNVRAEALFNAGRPLEAAQVFADALNDLPESQDSRGWRNSWATGAVNAYKYAFELDTTQCATSHAGLALADDYLAGLLAVYGPQAKDSPEYKGLRTRRDALDQSRTQTQCPEPASASVGGVPASVPAAPGPVRAEPLRADPAPESAAAIDPMPGRRSSPGLKVGIGVSAALTVGMAIGTGVLYSQLRRGGGRLYKDVQDAAIAAGVPTDEDSDMCKSGSGDLELINACKKWDSRHKSFLTTAVLTGVFAASAAVLTGLLIRERRHSGPTVALLRRHQAQVGVMPHLGRGASLTAGFHF